MTAKDYLPSTSKPTLRRLCQAAQHCQGCDLYEPATQTVFGEGPSKAKLMLIGEQPGDQEDIAGEPFVGPAGKLLRNTLERFDVDPKTVYITNAVKHFKFREKGNRRLHVKPSAREITACRPWLTAEIQAVAPAMIVCLGATACRAIFGPSFRLTKRRGEAISTDEAEWTMATYHPSALLRVPSKDARKQMAEMFDADLRQTAEQLRTLETAS